MIPELGTFALILALAVSLAMVVLPLYGAHTGHMLLMRTATPLAVGTFTLISISFACLVYAFVTDDFSVAYVANHSNSLLPVNYKFSAVWGGHEGSLSLWLLMLGGWTLAIALFSRPLPLDMRARVLAVMGFVSVGFLLFTLLTSNPFDRILPLAPGEGSDLNPLLQDFGLIVHPPLLYMGYVGFSTTFAFAIAALLAGRFDTAWARWSRPWANMAWAFLTIGIALGSWWAYYELGWGGWWFWDPVENASFLPWLVGTALIHSLAVTEKRGMFKSWTLLLAIFTFSLSLLGTFMVRSGVLTSVHSFANDPERGLFILLFLLVVVGGSLTLFALRAPVVKSLPGFSWLSRETLLLCNNILLMIAMLTVLLGTLYPMIHEALGLGMLSVGPPYFNTTFIPIMAVLCVLLAIGPLSNWKRTSGKQLLKTLWRPWMLSLVIGLLFPVFYRPGYSIAAAAAVFVGSWIVSATVTDIWQKIAQRPNRFRALTTLSLSYYGMVLAHTGMAVTLLGVCLNTVYSELRDVRMDIGQQVNAANYEFILEDVYRVEGPNYVADEARVTVMHNGRHLRELFPQKRRYLSGGNTMTEVAIDPGFFRDLYVAMGEPLNGTAWAMRVHLKPFVRWIWLGAILMALGGTLAVADRRYRRGRHNADKPLAEPA